MASGRTAEPYRFADTSTQLADASARPLVAVIGPTGSGKSDLALYLAEAFH